MPSKLKHIDDFLRDKNEEMQADKSRMNADWQQMKQLLAGAFIVPGKKTGKVISARKYLSYAAGTILAIAVTTLIILPGKKKGTSATTQTAINKTPITRKSTPPTATLPVIKKVIPVKKDVNFVKSKNQPTQKKTIPLNLPVKKQDEKIVAIVEIEKPAEINSKAAFENFYSSLQKPAQEFIINTKYDTTIRCNEGTTVFIPAGSFQTIAGLAITGTIKIAIREFYSFADIIGNKLTTLSDGQPLVTGGMLNIQATANSEPVIIKQGVNLDLIMPTRKFDPEMQLFIGKGSPGGFFNMEGISETTNNDAVMRMTQDTTKAKIDVNKTVLRDTVAFRGGGLNWIAAGQRQFFLNDQFKNITLFNLTDNPYEITNYKKNTKTLAKFRVPYNSGLSTEQIRDELEKRYSKYYDKIRLRKEWKPWRKNRRTTATTHNWYETNMVGDSITIPLAIATRRKLITKEDSINYEAKFRKAYEEALKTDQSYAQYLQIRERYDFRISNLGWFNCDRFYKYLSSRLTEFVLNPGEGFEGAFMQVILILDKENAALPGYWNNGKISFSQIPTGKQVHVICVGAKDGKVFTSIQQFTVLKNETARLQFEETTPEQFREKLTRFGKVTGTN